MEATANTNTNTVVTAIAGTLGIIHFIGQSVADIALHTEVKLVNKHIGTDAQAIIDNRKAITEARQQSIINKVSELQQKAAALRNK